MPIYEGVNVSGVVAGFDFEIHDRVQNHSVDVANPAVTFNRVLLMADEEYKRAGNKLPVATIEVPFKADSPEALDAALEASRQLPTEQTLRNTVLSVEVALKEEEDREVENIRQKLRKRAAGMVTEVFFGGAGAGAAVIGGIEAIGERSYGWALLAIGGVSVAAGGFADFSRNLEKTTNYTSEEIRQKLRNIHRRQNMVELAKHATEPVKETGTV